MDGTGGFCAPGPEPEIEPEPELEPGPERSASAAGAAGVKVVNAVRSGGLGAERLEDAGLLRGGGVWEAGESSHDGHGCEGDDHDLDEGQDLEEDGDDGDETGRFVTLGGVMDRGAGGAAAADTAS
jgi:hypothetical protein